MQIELNIALNNEKEKLSLDNQKLKSMMKIKPDNADNETSKIEEVKMNGLISESPKKKKLRTSELENIIIEEEEESESDTWEFITNSLVIIFIYVST